jgi:hypothetical protein
MLKKKTWNRLTGAFVCATGVLAVTSAPPVIVFVVAAVGAVVAYVAIRRPVDTR